jgi:predicted pyridoxine 5'-phosphate oxidase superfamily flavin-nucleotide-binding protein
MTDEMKQRVDNAFEEKKYCVRATTSDDGFPDMSFRGSTFVFDDEHIAFWDRSFGASTTKLEINPHVSMHFYDKENRLGWGFYGTATIHKDGNIRQQIMRRTVKGELDKDPERKG